MPRVIKQKIDGVVQEICRWNLSGDCLRYGDKALHFKGRCCRPCDHERSRRAYIDKRDAMLEARQLAMNEEIAKIQAEIDAQKNSEE